MIANILTTILLAVGIATGNVSSNIYKGGNAFNNEIEKQPLNEKRSNQNYTQSIYWHKITEWRDNNTSGKYTDKCYLSKLPNDTTATSNLMLDNMIIYNSVYEASYDVSRYQSRTTWTSEAYYIMQIKNIYNSQSVFNMRAEMKINVQNNGTYSVFDAIAYHYTDYDTLLQAIDITTTAGTITTLRSILYGADAIGHYTTIAHENTQQNISDGWYHVGIETQRITLEQNEIYYLVIILEASYTAVTNPGSLDTLILNNGSTISSEYISPDINYEIVDIPNLMYTIITMPFSFISTAFNLTLFPGTAYSVNISNIFMVIIAAFILLWIIKKVL